MRLGLPDYCIFTPNKPCSMVSRATGHGSILLFCKINVNLSGAGGQGFHMYNYYWNSINATDPKEEKLLK